MDQLSVRGRSDDGVFVERSDETVATRYFHLDHTGSVSVITDESGVVVELIPLT